MTSRVLLAVCVSILTASCGGTVRYGLANTPVAEATSDNATLQAIQHSLDTADSGCAIRLIERGEPKATGPNATVEAVSAEVCGKSKRYEIKRIRTKEDQVMVVAKAI